MKFPRSSIGLDDNILISVNPTALWYVRLIRCTNAALWPWVDIKMFAIVAENSGLVTIVAVTDIVQNARQANRHFGSKTA